jgi:hypothetical protein
MSRVISKKSQTKLNAKLNSKRSFDNTDPEGFQFGESGYIDIMDAIQQMVENGYGVVDIMLSIGEQFDKAKATQVLEDARARGIL